MSASKYAYSPSKCDGEFCIGDCDLCYKANLTEEVEENEIEQDGVMKPSYLLESVSAEKARPAAECLYPKCGRCDQYHGHYCTVPIVVTKQMYKMSRDEHFQLLESIRELEDRVDYIMYDVLPQREERP